MAQTLETIIAINARSNGFSDVGNTLTQLGVQIDQLSEKLINFGRDSLDTYEDYEKNMAEARGALATRYGRDTKELDEVMHQLDSQARVWASTTIFHTDDVGHAITEAAHAGWDLDQIMTGIPAAMRLAQAAGIDLSDALYYITEAAKAGQIEFGDLSEFTDMWAYAANNSNGTIETFGDSMLRLGSVMNFAGSREELLALIAIMHETGTEGATSATLLRTAMMNILAPSGTAGTVLEQLGATEEEIRSIREDASKVEALNILESYGFSAFDENGQAKPILTIFHDLRDVLSEIAGGYENIDKNETTLGILGTIFGKRGITGALNIMNMLEYGNELVQDLQSGAAEGYGSYLSDTMMDTLYGDLETWESKVENLKLRTGETLAAQVEPALESLGGIIDDIANMDTGTFNALVSGLEVIAAAGPGMLLAGGAFRFIGNAAAVFTTPVGMYVGAAALAIIATTGLMSVLDALYEADYASKFGDLSLDNSQVKTYVDGLKTSFDDAMASITAYDQALTAAVDRYTTSSSTLKSNLLTDMLTGTEIKEGTKEYDQLVGLGEDMIAAVNDGILNNYSSTMTSVTQLAGEDTENPIWTQIIDVLEAQLQEELGRAEALGKKLRDTLFNAITNDGKLTADEMADIQSIMDEQNELLALQIDREHYIQRQSIMRKAQTLGLDAIRESSALVEAERDSEWNDLLERQSGDMFDLMAAYDRAIANGTEIAEVAQDENGNYYLTGRNIQATEADKEMARAWLAQRQENQRYEWTGRFSDFLMGIWTEGITSSELNGQWGSLEELGRSYREAGGFVTQEAAQAYNSSGSAADAQQTADYLMEMVEALGGREVLQGYYDYFEGIGDIEMAENYRRIMDMYDALGGVPAATADAGTHGEGDHSDVMGSYEQMATLLSGAGTNLTPEGLATALAQHREWYGTDMDAEAWNTLLGEGLYRQMSEAALASGYNNLTGWIEGLGIQPSENTYPIEVVDQIDREIGTIARMRGQIADITENGLWQNINGNTSYRLPDEQAEARVQQIEADISVRQNALADLYSENGIAIPVTPYVEGTDAMESLRDQGVQVQVDGDTQQLDATIEAEDGQTLMQYVSGDATDLHMSIMDENGQTLVENVTGDASQLESIISRYNGQTIRLNLSGMRMFAEGGRATTASIFGEGDTAEWAIPEEHSERTAALLDRARAASGFTWAEILSRYGGLNANPTNRPTTLVYSPTIYAENADGVDQKLLQDKDRLEKWYAEKQMMDRLEVYA